LEFSEKIEQSYYFFIGMEDLGQLEEKWQSKIQKKELKSAKNIFLKLQSDK